MIANKSGETEYHLCNESDLLKRISDGDRHVFGIVYSHYMDELYRYVYLFTKSKERTEDIVQTVFVKVWEQRGSLATVLNFKNYLFRCAKNQLLDEVRREKVKQKVFSALVPAKDGSGEKADSKIIYQQYHHIAQEAIHLLPRKRKQIVEMRTRDQMSLDEIADHLSISKSVVKKQLYAGLVFVREYFEKNAELTSATFFILVFSHNFFN